MFIKILNKMVNLVACIPDIVRYTFYYRNCSNYKLYSVSFFKGGGVKVYGKGIFIAGEGSYCGERCAFQVEDDRIIKIGSNTAISHNVRVYTSNRNPIDIIECIESVSIISGDVIIGNNCWIGANVFIKEGVSIGDNVVIGANSVVSKSIPSFCIAAGAPIKILKQIKEPKN